MKKLVAVVLLLVLIAPAAALSERDPVVGSYYTIQDYSLYPEMASTGGGVDMIIMVLTFYEDGTIMMTENDITGKDGKQVFSALGKWTKTNTSYTVSLIGWGEGDLIIEENSVLIPVQEMGHLRMHKMEPMNPYKDLVISY